jgi:hypothetical protein
MKSSVEIDASDRDGMLTVAGTVTVHKTGAFSKLVIQGDAEQVAIMLIGARCSLLQICWSSVHRSKHGYNCKSNGYEVHENRSVSCTQWIRQASHFIAWPVVLPTS